MDTDASGSGGWRFAQCFGDKGEVEDITEGNASRSVPTADVLTIRPSADIISTVEFDSTGNYLATGDKGGRVVLFERNEMVSDKPSLSSRLVHTSSRKRAVNTSSTPSSSRTNQNSTISSHLRSKRRSTRSSGAEGKMLLISSYLPMVRSLWSALHDLGP